MIRKTLMKTLSYAAMHMGVAIGIAYALSGSWKVAISIGLAEPCVQIVAFFFHERAWHRYEHRHGQKHHSDSVIESTTPLTQVIEKILRHRH